MGRVLIGMKRQNKKKRALERAYYTPQIPGSFGGVEALKRATKSKRSAIREWLSYQDTYTLHKPVRRKFTRRRVIVGGIDHQWQADLIDVQRLKKDNDGITYLLTVIDVLSKHAWVVPLKNKTGSELTRAFESILDQGRKPLKLQTDKGTEFLNQTFRKYLKARGVDFFVTQNEDIKASVVERFNRTLKEKLWRYFTRKNTQRFVEVLPSLVRAYNRSFHRSIQRAPLDVTSENQEEVWQTLYGRPPAATTRPKLRIGDRVRISKARKTFKKGYLASWTEELFTVSGIRKTTPPTYVLKDDRGEELEGSFYEREIQKVGNKEIYRVEAILEQRTRRGGDEYLVKWYGYPSSFNSWIPRKALTSYTH